MNDNVKDLLERIIYKLTSGRFIFTVVVAFVYAWLAIHGDLEEERINEITLIVLYAYFNRTGATAFKKAEGDKDEKIEVSDEEVGPKTP